MTVVLSLKVYKDIQDQDALPFSISPIHFPGPIPSEKHTPNSLFQGRETVRTHHFLHPTNTNRTYTSRKKSVTPDLTPPSPHKGKMCYYRETTFRCGHTRKLPIPPCRLLPSCSIVHDLVELSEDLGSVRAAIRMLNLGQTRLQGYREVLGQIMHNFPAFFGHGSSNGSRTLDSLRELETYLEGEINRMGTVRERDRVNVFCSDSCWEGVCEMGREEQFRRGHFQRQYY